MTDPARADTGEVRVRWNAHELVLSGAAVSVVGAVGLWVATYFGLAKPAPIPTNPAHMDAQASDAFAGVVRKVDAIYDRSAAWGHIAEGFDTLAQVLERHDREVANDHREIANDLREHVIRQDERTNRTTSRARREATE